jgi:hypothetical protein
MNGDLILGFGLFAIIIGIIALVVSIIPVVFLFKTSSLIKAKLPNNSNASHLHNALVVIVICTIISIILSAFGAAYAGVVRIFSFIVNICNVVFAVNLFHSVKKLIK